MPKASKRGGQMTELNTVQDHIERIVNAAEGMVQLIESDSIAALTKEQIREMGVSLRKCIDQLSKAEQLRSTKSWNFFEQVQKLNQLEKHSRIGAAYRR